MQNPTGAFIVLEGSDGSGKSTQFKLLSERLKAVGYEIEVFKFPQYDKESSYFVKKYLNGDYGPANAVSPYTATLFYALDRFEASAKIKQALESGKIVLCDRYVGSNMAHQGGKFTDPVEQRGFFVWEDSIEYQLLGLPRPTVSVFLKVPVEISVQLTSKDKSRSARSYTAKVSDEHEKDVEHLKRSVETYNQLCSLFPNDFKAIDCVRDGTLLSIPEVNNLIWEVIKPILPPKPASPGHDVTINLAEASKPPKQVESIESQSDDKNLLINRKISLKLLLDLGPEPLNYDTGTYSWASTNYGFFTPDLPEKTKQKYSSLMKEITLARQRLDRNIKKYSQSKKLSYPATPLAALASIKTELRLEEAQLLIKKLAALDYPEARSLLEEVVPASKIIWGGKIKSSLDTSLLTKPEKIDSIIHRLVNEHLPQQLPDNVQSVNLIEATPKNEFKVLVDFVYPMSELSRPTIAGEIDNLSYQEKVRTLTALLNSEKTVGLDQLLYKFDITLDRLTINKLTIDDPGYSIKVQSPTPRFGYDVNKQLDDHGLVDDYLTCFDLSLELFSTLQPLGKDNITPYGVMLGHKSRFQLICSVGYLKKLQEVLNNALDSDLYNDIAQAVAGSHPIVGAVLLSTAVNRPKKR